jgi:hypothetical protein
MINVSLSTMLRSILVFAVFANLTACTHSTRRHSSPMPKFHSIAVVNKGATSELKARFGMDSADSHIGAGAATGAVLAGTGAALTCGPFVLLCALAVVNFAAAGAIGGGLAGAASDTQQTLPNEQLLLLDRQFIEISQQRTINQEIEESLMRKVPPERVKESPDATALLQFRLYDVRFSKNSSRKYALTLKTVMLFRWDRTKRPPSSASRIYEHTSIALPMEEWVNTGGITLNQAFDTCIEGLTDKMIRDIQFQNL